MPSCNNREIPLHRGRFLGGSSGTNTCFAIRGTKHDTTIGTFLGGLAETFHPKDWFQHDPKAHGTGGPVNIAPHNIAPITELMLQSYQSYGLPLHPDMFSTGEQPNGCGHALRTIHNGLRSTGADYVTNARYTKNVETLTNTLVDKVTLEMTGDGGLRATGVELVCADGSRLTARARREVVVSGGAYCSPTILMRSGIGPREELQKFGIECRVDSPGVGQNLEDHVIAFIPYEVSKPGLTTDHLSWHGDAAARNLADYRKDGSGFLGAMPFGTFAYARLDQRLKDSSLWQEALSTASPGRDPMGLSQHQPNIEAFHTECAPAGFEPESGEASIFCTVVELFGPRSAGTVRLASADPHDNPLVDHNYFADPLDLEVLAEAAHFMNDIVMEGTGTAPVMKGSFPADGQHHAFKNREEWKPWLRDHCQTCYHPSGTCKMGKDDDRMAVLDEKCRVRGVQGLRVADTSVMPKIPNGHTQMPAYGVGERCADFMKESAKL
ncbi:hypothetical protein LTR37_003872 [Vermiconidia calcicola]|uniref:Uncharacterized protein n=1 Tax=Vermiconidia calcicola TaxID=1690605 RepID=A0ACC3NNX5_9PEZI|nr:hypothetical protein LTR37_003872 [Vermiconidia calcicola]